MEATLALPLLVGLIAVALVFDFLNGLHAKTLAYGANSDRGGSIQN